MDLSNHASLEISGCKPDPDHADHIVRCSDDEATFWTVYARRKSGEADAVSDWPTRAAATAELENLSASTGLPAGNP